MKKLTHGVYLGVGTDSLFEEILDGLDVMIGDSFDFFYGSGVSVTELLPDPVQQLNAVVRKTRHFGNVVVVRQGDQPGYLYPHALSHQTVFAEDGS